MTSITVQQTGFGLVVAEDGDTDAAALLDGLPPLRAARYLTATPALRQALRGAEPALVDAVRPHLQGTVVVPEDGLAGAAQGDAAGSARLAQALGVSVIAPAGRFIRGDGTLFSVGGGDGWVTQSPRGGRVPAGRRYPAPAWQSQLPHDLTGAAHIPAGLWITSGTDPRHAVRLAGIAVRERQLLVVVGSPAETPPTLDRLLAVLRPLPDGARSAIVLAGFGSASLPVATVRELAVRLGQPVRVAHGVELDGAPVRIDGDAETLPTTLALESVCAPDGTVTLERWAPPPGLVADAAAVYRLGETRKAWGRPGDAWVVEVVAAGLVVRPATEPLADVSELEPPIGSIGIFVQGDGAYRPEALPALLAPFRARLEQRGAVTIHPLDAAGRRLVRDAYPGQWAPTESLAITADGRLVAATADATGDTDRPLEELPDIADAEGASAAAEGAETAVEADEAVAEADSPAEVEVEVEVEFDAEVGDAAPAEAESFALATATTTAAETTAVEPDAPVSTAVDESAAYADQQDAPTAPRARRRADVPRAAAPTTAVAPKPSTTVDAVVGAEPTTATTGDVPTLPTLSTSGRRARRIGFDGVPTGLGPDADASAATAAPTPFAPTSATDADEDPWSTSAAEGAVTTDPRTPAATTAPSIASTTPATTATPANPAPATAAPAPTSSAPAPSSALPATPSTRREAAPPASTAQESAATGTGTGTGTAAAAAEATSTPRRTADDALTRALQGSAATRLLGATARDDSTADRSASTATAPTSVAPTGASPTAPATPAAPPVPLSDASVTATAAIAAAAAPASSQPTPAAAASEQPAADAAPAPATTSTPDRPRAAAPIDVPAGASSTSDQRHRVRTALGSRYDVASRTVAQLLAQQPGMRVAAGDRSAMLTGLSLVRVFASEPHGDYDLDFHTCLAEGLAMLPTARSVVVRGIPSGVDAAPGSTLRLRSPLVAAAADGPATGPAEALIWTTSGRRLDRVLHGSPGAADVVLPAGARLRVLGSAEGSAPRLLLAEEGADAELALTRLQAAAETRGGLRPHLDDRWFGELPPAA
ncbi:hypothetical protein [Schumannella soli]|uniref:Uncharacterized protein n=1 Tax=Schumannella soli TaxID=2590779 RepID=A0A506Y7Q0_9MICO|nr:hypothetical protein [Schumannella soli]TPW77903.1 hypothetical protein FJ657_04480 [Schumannella soli]